MIVLHRAWKRYALEVFFFVFVAVTFFVAGRAFAVEPERVKFLNQKPEQYIIAKPVPTTTSTTTTTQAPKPLAKKQAPSPVAVPQNLPLPSGTHQDWMREAGIPEDQWPYVELLIERESGWRPHAVNAGGCIGLGQNCGKKWLAVACPNWPTDPVCQLRRFNEYAQRWNGWEGHQGAWKGSWMHSEGTNPHWY